MFRTRLRRNISNFRRLLGLTCLEDRHVPTTLYGIIGGSNSLVAFDSATPGTLLSNIAVTGLGAGETVEGIDFRPATGELYGLGVNGTSARIGTINRVTGAFSPVGSAFTVAGATDYGFDFNPTNDRIRITSSSGENLAVNPGDASVTVQTSLNPGTPSIVGSAYSNPFANATTTTLFAIDSGTDELFTQVPATGVLTSVGSLKVSTSSDVGFDIAGNGTAYATLVTGLASQLHTINLSTGEATLVGQVGAAPLVLRGLAVGKAVWDGGGADANWTTAANWVGDVAPQAGDDLFFGESGALQIATSNNDFAAGTTFNSITFTQSGYTVSGNAITLDHGILDSSTGGANAFNLDIALGQSQIVSVAAASQTLSLGGAISNSTGASLNKEKVGATNNAGTLQFTGALSNTYNGTTSVNGGTIVVARTGSAISIPGALVIGDDIGTAGSAVVRATANDNIANTSNITVRSDGVLDMNDFSDTVGALFVIGGQVALGKGTLSTGDANFDAASTFKTVLVNKSTVGHINVTGGVTLGGNLTFSFAAPPPAGDKMVLIANDGSDSVTGTFNGLPEGAIFTSGGTTFKISYLGGDGNDVELTAGFAPTFTGPDNVSFTAGTADTFLITTNGAPNAVITQTGTLPTGVTFTDNKDGTAKISGTPAQNGQFTLNLKAANGIAPDATQTFTLTVNQAPSITSVNNFTAQSQVAFNFKVTTAGFPTANLNLTGTLPSGVTFNDNGDGTADLSGTPSPFATGKFAVTINAANGISPDASQSFTLTINQPPTFLSADTAIADINKAFTAPISVSGFPDSTYSFTGTLPAGVTFTDNKDGTAKISGTPTKAGEFVVNVKASNGVAPDATQAFTLTVQQVPGFTSGTAITVTRGTNFSFPITTNGFPAPTITLSGTLPTGATFTDNKDGTAKISGTPTQTGDFTITLKAENGVTPDATQAINLRVREAPAITSPAAISLTKGNPANFTITTTGFPIATISKSGTLPAGITFTDNGDGTGSLSGTPTVGGTFSVTFTANNGVAPAATQVATITIADTIFAVGADAGGLPIVNVYNSDGTIRASFFAFDGLFLGGVRVATGDVTGDGVEDVITAAGPTGGPHVKVFDGVSLTEIRSFFAYDAAFTGGVFVAAGDVDGDGRFEVITGADAGGGPHVKAFSGQTGGEIRSFFAYDAAFTGGVRVAAGDLDGDGKDDIITGAGPGGGPHVEVFSGANTALLRSFFAYDPAYTGGVYVAGGDFNRDGTEDIVTGAGAGGTAHVLAYSGKDNSILSSFLAYDPAFTGGVRVAVEDVNSDGFADILTGAGPGATPHVEAFRGADAVNVRSFFAFDPAFLGGVFVG